jgi:hypothetical protein
MNLGTYEDAWSAAIAVIKGSRAQPKWKRAAEAELAALVALADPITPESVATRLQFFGKPVNYGGFRERMRADGTVARYARNDRYVLKLTTRIVNIIRLMDVLALLGGPSASQCVDELRRLDDSAKSWARKIWKRNRLLLTDYERKQGGAARQARKVAQERVRFTAFGPPLEEVVDAYITILQHELEPGSLPERLRLLRRVLDDLAPGIFGPHLTAQVRALRAPKKRTTRPPVKRIGLPREDWVLEKRRYWDLATRKATSSYRGGGVLSHLSRGRLKHIESHLGLFYAFCRDRRFEDTTVTAVEAFVKYVRDEYSSGYAAQLLWGLYVGEKAMLSERTLAAPSMNDPFGDDDEPRQVPAGYNQFAEDDSRLAPEDEAAEDVAPDQYDEEGEHPSHARRSEPLAFIRDHAIALKAVAVGLRDKRKYRVELRDLIFYGFDLMDDAEKMAYGEEAALTYQVGFFIATLGCRCVRLATILSTDIPRSGFVEPGRGWVEIPEDGPWWFHWPASVNKNGEVIRTIVPTPLRPRLARWVGHFRKALAGSVGNQALFVSRLTGNRWSKGQAREAFKAAMRRRFEVALPPQLVRDINAAFICETLPQDVMDGMLTDILAHLDPKSDAHYVKMVKASWAAGRLMAAIIEERDGA